MSTKWEEDFNELIEYIEDSPAIKIGDVISIPSGAKANFYNKFDKVRLSILKNVLAPDSLDRASFLSRAYTGLEKEIVDKLGLKQIILEPRLSKFLKDPGSELMAGLYFPLFDLLKGKTSRESFLKHCSLLQPKFHKLYQSVYCKWVALSLLKLFNAKRIGAFYMPFSARKQRRGILVKDRPRLVAADFIDFDSKKPFVSPDFAAYSPEMGCYLAVKTEIQKGFAKFAYSSPSSKLRKWQPLDANPEIFASENVFVYLSRNIEEISLLINKAACCPDVLIRCFTDDSRCTEEALQETMLLHKTLNPRSTYAICQSPANGQYETCDGIHVINAGLDYARLTDIVDDLLAPFKTTAAITINQGNRPKMSGGAERMTTYSCIRNFKKTLNRLNRSILRRA